MSKITQNNMMDDMDLENMPLEEMKELCCEDDDNENTARKVHFHDNDRKFRCPLCHSVLKGRRGLNIHLRRVHFSNDEKRAGASLQKKLSDKKDWSRDRFDAKNELKIQEVLVKAVYGSARVAEVIKDYIEGKYTIKELPINISYYIRLKGIKPEKKDKKEEKKEKEKKPEEKPEEVSVSMFLNVLRKKPENKDSEWEKTILGIKLGKDSYVYVSDIAYDDSEKVLKVLSGKDSKDNLKASEAQKYLEEYDDGKDINRKVYLLKFGRRIVRKIIQKEKDLDRWIVLNCTDKEQ